MARMANTIRYESKPDFHNPIIIEGLPGVGNVGKLAADFVADKLNAKTFARIYSDDLPPQVLVNEECVIEPVCHELKYAKTADGRDLIFIMGAFQANTPAGQYNLTEYEFKQMLPYDPSLMVTLGGYGTGEVVTDPRVFGVVSDAKMKTEYEQYGILFAPNEPKGGIVGAAAMFVAFGKIYGIKSISVIGETSGFIIDVKSARNVIDVLSGMFGTEIDTSDLNDAVNQIEKINSKAKELKPEPAGEDLSYIG